MELCCQPKARPEQKRDTLRGAAANGLVVGASRLPDVVVRASRLLRAAGTAAPQWTSPHSSFTALLAAVAMLALTAGPAAGAVVDVQEAVKRVAPATVAVEWRAQETEDATSSATTPDADPYMANQTAHALLGLAAANTLAADSPKPDAVVLASGTLLSADGLIVTRLDEVRTGSLSVTLRDGRELPARLLVDDRRSGLQLLKVDAEELPFVQLADEPARVGQAVMAVMCVSPREIVVATGIVAAANRSLPGFGPDVLQTDMGVTPMSAGAPLADVEGQLLGIIAAGADEGPNQQKVALAVPATSVRALLDARKGDDSVLVYQGYLGVQLTSDEEAAGPVKVQNVVPDSPAATSGLRKEDEILYVGGREVASSGDVVRYIRGREAGDKVTITIRRDGKERPVEVTLGRYPAKPRPTHDNVLRIWELQPGAVYPGVFVRDKDGSLEYRVPGADAQQQEAINRAYDFLLRQQGGAPNAPVWPHVLPHPSVPATPTIRVQRSDVEKKLDDLTVQIQSLRQDLQDLTAQLKELQKRLDTDPPSEE